MPIKAWVAAFSLLVAATSLFAQTRQPQAIPRFEVSTDGAAGDQSVKVTSENIASVTNIDNLIKFARRARLEQNYADAERAFERASSLAKPLGAPEKYAEILVELASVYRTLGKIQACAGLLKKAEKLTQNPALLKKIATEQHRSEYKKNRFVNIGFQAQDDARETAPSSVVRDSAATVSSVPTIPVSPPKSSIAIIDSAFTPSAQIEPNESDVVPQNDGVLSGEKEASAEVEIGEYQSWNLSENPILASSQSPEHLELARQSSDHTSQPNSLSNNNKNQAEATPGLSMFSVTLIIITLIAATALLIVGFSPLLRARLLHVTGFHHAASEIIEKTIVGREREAKLWMFLAQTYLAIERQDEQAISVYEKVLVLNIVCKNQEKMSWIVAQDYLAKNRQDEFALGVLERALKFTKQDMKLAAS